MPETDRAGPGPDAPHADANGRSLLPAYLLWAALGPLGAHRFYTGNTASAVVLLVATLACFVVTYESYGAYVFVFAAPAAWLAVDAVLIPGMVRRFNARLAQRPSAPSPPGR